MLVQPTRDLEPLALLQLEIPDRTQPMLPSGAWGINIAAAQDLAPDKGLKVFCPQWSAMGEGDKIVLLLNGQPVDQDTIDKEEVGQRTTLFVPPGRLHTGAYTLAYRVTRLHQVPETMTPAVNIYVKLERPGGQDLDPEEGAHSELYMFIDPVIIQDGVDKDTAAKGVDIIVRHKPGSASTQPYPNIAPGDRCKLSWGGIYVFSDPVTPPQISDPDTHPITIHVDEATIREAGDSDAAGLAVTFQVQDLVDNRSEDWCAEQRIVVDTGRSRLMAPIVKEAINNVLDLDKLADAAVHLQILALALDFKLGDVIVAHVKGTTLEGEAVEDSFTSEPLSNVPSVVELPLKNAVARLLAQTQAIFSYRVQRSGEPDQPSKGSFVQIVGEPTRLLAPTAEDAHQGALDPTLATTLISIPFDDVMEEGMAIVPRWVGTKPDFNTYDPALDWHFISRKDAADRLPISIVIDGLHLRAIDGGTLDLFYELLAEVGDTILKRESIHHTLLRVGEPKLELVPPIVLGETDGVLNPEDLPNGLGKITIPNPMLPTKSGDKVTYTWLGSVSGKTTDYQSINSFNANKDVLFNLDTRFVADHLLPNVGGTVRVSYEILRAATADVPERVSYSDPLEFSVGVALELAPPALVAPATNPIDVLAYANGVTVRVTFAGNPGDKAQLKERTPTPGNPPFPAQDFSAGQSDFLLSPAFLAARQGGNVELNWELIRGGVAFGESLPLSLKIDRIADGDVRLPMPVINGNTTDELDTTRLPANAQLTIAPWLNVPDECLWLDYDGIDQNGAVVVLPDLTGTPHTTPPGLSRLAPVEWLKALKDGTRCMVKFSVNFDKVPNKTTAVQFPIASYNIKSGSGFEFDDTPMSFHASNIHFPGLVIKSNAPDKFAQTRSPTRGKIPFTYQSGDINVALVEKISESVRVIAIGNGDTTITVRDASGETKQFTVSVRNVRTILVNDTPLNNTQAIAWKASVGGEFYNHSDGPIILEKYQYSDGGPLLVCRPYDWEFTYYPGNGHSAAALILNGFVIAPNFIATTPDFQREFNSPGACCFAPT